MCTYVVRSVTKSHFGRTTARPLRLV